MFHQRHLSLLNDLADLRKLLLDLILCLLHGRSQLGVVCRYTPQCHVQLGQNPLAVLDHPLSLRAQRLNGVATWLKLVPRISKLGPRRLALAAGKLLKFDGVERRQDSRVVQAVGSVRIVYLGHEHAPVSRDGLKPTIVLRLDTHAAKQGVVLGRVAIEADPRRPLLTVQPLVLTLRTDDFGIDPFRVADLNNFEHRVVYRYEFRVGP